jgi:hypothetical protein
VKLLLQKENYIKAGRTFPPDKEKDDLLRIKLPRMEKPYTLDFLKKMF